MLAWLSLVVLLPGAGRSPQSVEPPSSAVSAREAFERLQPLVGHWRGEGSGFGLLSDVDHEWRLVLQGRFLELRTRSSPRASTCAGETHEDFGFLSWDADRGALVFRQFLSEGFVNTFDVRVGDGEGLTLRFDHRESESASGMKARMRLHFESPDRYEMVLDLASPGKDFAPCQRMLMHRAP